MSTTSNDFAIKGILIAGEQLYLKEKMSDFHFICKSAEGQDEEIPVHTFLLASVSDVLDTMVNNWDNINAVITDATSAEFKEFLQFFYLGRAKITMNNVAKVMYLGDKYNVPECLNVCTKFLRRTLTEENVCWGLALAILYRQEDLKRYCKLMVSTNIKTVFASNGFLECEKEVLEHILKMDSLSCTEVEVFNACIVWLKSASGESELTRETVQNHLGDLFFQIRYRSMPFADFAEIVSSYGGLFSLDEHQEIVQLIGIQNYQANLFNGNLREGFVTHKRTNLEKIKCSRVVTNNIVISPYLIKNMETTRFSTNEPLVLKMFTCTALTFIENNQYMHRSESLPSEMTIVEMSDSTMLGNEVVLYNAMIRLCSISPTEVSLTKSVLLKPGCLYEIRFKQDPPTNCCTFIQMSSEMHLQSDIVIQFHSDLNVSNNDIGDQLIWGLIQDFVFIKI
ncbi:uncharacterized protein LOC116349724 [Contarinia nasturtii]|uniref:uncharacterized protein LOC116349724 n=1 Tax=Contarinia nasturtii TaxID=265458 RepID=UPI0012D4678B|nr:uncharacterized protein LOC116349724 [Contarinia nasturtii]XP_031637149.1 uncharacterized protein LOC116349724 [Contarinia nasturtii]